MRSTVRNSNIIITSGDNLTIDPNRGSFKKQFPSSFTAKRAKIGLESLSIYYSWSNLTQLFNNLTGASYRLNGTDYPVNYPDGFYTLEQLDGFFNFTMDANKHYLLDDTQQKVFFLRFEPNPPAYCCTLTVTPIPATLPTGWSNPNNLTLSGEAPQLNISASTDWGKLIGFAPGLWPQAPATTTTQLNGTLVPKISNITTILVLCDMVNEGRFSIYPTVIGSFVPNVSFGSLITYTPQSITTYDVIPRSYAGVEVRFVDQDYRPLQIKDPTQTVVTLLLEEEELL